MNDYKEVKSILRQIFKNKEVSIYLFGSRAKGAQRPDSDLDLLFWDEKNLIKPSTLIRLEELFENSNIPFKVDIVLKSRIDQKFFDNISKDLVAFNYS